MDADAAPPAVRRALRPPARSLRFLEQRAPFEAGALLASSPLLRLAGRGDSHPVFVLPGFTGGDRSTVALRAALRSWGYWAHGWQLGSNLGPTPAALAGIRERLDALHDRHGKRVSLVGWSAGGLYARHLARLAPEKVRQVVTLGSPLQMRAGDRSAASVIADRLESRFDPDFRRLADPERGVLPVPSTSVYTRTDGVVRWQVCLDVVDERHENVEVLASHSGLGFHPPTLYVLADRLGQPEDDWRPFSPPSWARRLYPRPVGWRG